VSAPFAGQVAIVSGAAGGIGLACAMRLAADGAAVLLADVKAGPVAEAAAALADMGRRAKPFAVDLADADAIDGLVAEATSTFGRLDIVVNAAGIQPYGTVVDTAPDVWDRVMAVNLKAAYLIAGRSIPHMRKAGGGAIVNIASVQAFASSRRVAAYAASKAGLLGLTRAIAVDHAAEGIRCNAICPGSVDTPLLRFAAQQTKGSATEEEMIAGWGAMHPVGRVGRAEEIAGLVAFLAGPESLFINGAAITADGGVMAKLGILLPD